MDNLIILALDLGTKTGWILRSSDTLITSGTAEFKHDRYLSGGMRFLKFKQWLNQMLAAVDQIDMIYFEEVSGLPRCRFHSCLRWFPSPPNRMV